MIAAISGKLKSREPGRIVIETGGVGYEVFIPLTTYYRLPPPGMVVGLEIRQVVREDSLALYGFAESAEKRAFDLLLGVQHVGPRLALAILSVLQPAELAAAVAREDVARIDAVPGVGPKVAERVVRELRDKVAELKAAAVETAAAASGEPVDDAVSALINLGYKPVEARRAVDAVRAHDGAMDLGAVIRQSLALLSGEG